jgi:hypothetical protein
VPLLVIAFASSCFAPAAAPESAPPSPSASPALSQTPVATSAASPSVAASVYSNATLGYRVVLPAGYRVSSCGPWIDFGIDRMGIDGFTPLGEQAEREINTGDIPPRERFSDFSIWAHRNAQGLSAVEWARAQPQHASSRIEPVTTGGHDAAKITTSDSIRAVSYAVRADGRIYAIVKDIMSEGDDSERILGAVAATLQTIPLAPFPTTAPKTVEGAQAAANALAKAFRDRDATAVASHLRGCTLGNTAMVDAPVGHCCILGRSIFAFIEALRPALTSGAAALVVDPTLRGPAAGRDYFVSAQWTEGGRTRRIDLILDHRGQGWFWAQAVHYFPPGVVCYGPIWGGTPC